MDTQENKSTRPKSQRIVALCGVILLALLYISSIICAILATPAYQTMFKISLISTILIPLVIFGYIKIAKIFTGRAGSQDFL